MKAKQAGAGSQDLGVPEGMVIRWGHARQFRLGLLPEGMRACGLSRPGLRHLNPKLAARCTKIKK